MVSIRNLALAGVAALGLALMSWSQGMMMRPPAIPGKFSPVVGSGAEYKITDKEGAAHDWALAVVGKEAVDGQEGYWLEMRTGTDRGKMIMKQLMVIQPGSASVKRMIMQPPGRPPMEMPMGMMMGRMGAGNQPPASEPEHGMGEMVGSESVTVPAGTFQCQHFRSTDKGKTTDVWVSAKVAPYGLVKMSGPETSMVLQKVLEDEKSQIQGEPQKMSFPGMPQ